MNILQKYESLIETLFVNKDLDREQDRNELIHKLQNEADYQLERSMLYTNLSVFLQSGMHYNALSCSELLGEVVTSIEILEKLRLTDRMKKLIEEDKVSLGSY